MWPADKGSRRPAGLSFRSDTTVVQIPVTVIDTGDHPVSGLHKENFRVFEDRVEQTLTYFASEDAPLSVGSTGVAQSELKKSLRSASTSGMLRLCRKRGATAGKPSTTSK